MKRALLFSTVLVTLALALVTTAQAAEPDIKFETYKLKNGLTVIMSEDHRLPQVAVNIWYHVGAANQTPGKSGFAHLFEHMMFSGSKHVQPAPFTILQSVGTVAGQMANGTTNFNRTNYFEVVPSNELATAVWIESDRMAFLLDTLNQKKLSIQRDVVSNERRQSYENRPYGVGRLKICDVLYPAPHPYYECVIGAIPQIQAASVDDLKSFFRAWYGPQNASLAIVGDFDPAQAKALVERYFGPVVGGTMPPRPNVEQPMLQSVVKETVEDKVAQVPRFSLVWNGIKLYSKDEAAADVLMFALGGSKASRLYKALVVDKQVATGVFADDNALGLGGWIEVSAVVRNGHDVSEMLPVMQAEIDRMKKEGPTAAEVQRAVRNLVADRVRELETLGGFGGKADILNMYQTYLGDPGYLGRDLQRYRDVTPEAVKAVAQKLLPDGKRLELSLVPATKTAGAK